MNVASSRLSALSRLQLSPVAKLLRPVGCCNILWNLQKHGIFYSSPSLQMEAASKRSPEDANKGDMKRFMKAWQLQSFDGIPALHHSDGVKIPYIKSPNDVLIEVHSSSVNPLDIAMTSGYGRNLLQSMKQLSHGDVPDIFSPQSDFPFTLGRDFSGKVVNKGQDVSDLDVGDEVFGVVSPYRDGAHAELTVTSSWEVVRKPQNLTHIESAAIPYAGLTAWSALCITGHISSRNANKLRVLLLGGSGGVGTFSIQLLRHWGAEVVTTCGPESIELMLSLGANVALDYTDFATEGELQTMKRFDVILDAAGTNNPKYLDLLKPWNYSKYITLSPPFLGNTDKWGVVGGLMKNAVDLTSANILSHLKGNSYRWAFFTPNRYALKEIRTMLDDGKIRPIIDSVYSFDQLPDAYEKVKSRLVQGKVVLDFDS